MSEREDQTRELACIAAPEEERESTLTTTRGRSAAALAHELSAGAVKRYGTQYPEVWVKEAHGGAYKKASAAPAPLCPRRPGRPPAPHLEAARPPRSESQAVFTTPAPAATHPQDIGYSSPQFSRTTNIVGNNMTQVTS